MISIPDNGQKPPTAVICQPPKGSNLADVTKSLKTHRISVYTMYEGDSVTRILDNGW